MLSSYEINLAIKFALMQIAQRYKSSFLGHGWYLLSPLIMLFFYTYIFGYILQFKFGGTTKISIYNYGIAVLLGIIIHNFFVDVITHCTNLVSKNSNIIKKTPVPIISLVFATILSSLVNLVIGVSIVAMLAAFDNGFISLKVVLLPVVIFPFIVIVTAFGLMATVVGAYIKDVQYVINIMSNILLFASTVFFPIDIFNNWYKIIIYLNPISVIIDNMRKIIIWDSLPVMHDLLVYYILSGVLFIISYKIFRKLKYGLIDVV